MTLLKLTGGPSRKKEDSLIKPRQFAT